MIASGAQPLDVRDPGEFQQGHLARSINIGLNGQYATWAGTLLNRNQPIVIIAAPGRETEGATRLGRIGFDNVAGYLDGGMQALDDRDDLLAYTPQTSGASIGRLAWRARRTVFARRADASRMAAAAHRGQRQYSAESVDGSVQ